MSLSCGWCFELLSLMRELYISVEQWRCMRTVVLAIIISASLNKNWFVIMPGNDFYCYSTILVLH